MSTINLPSPSELQAFKKIAIEAAQVGGEILQKYAKSGFAIEHKTRLNLVTDADRESEHTIVALLKQA